MKEELDIGSNAMIIDESVHCSLFNVYTDHIEFVSSVV